MRHQEWMDDYCDEGQGVADAAPVEKIAAGLGNNAGIIFPQLWKYV